MFNKLQAFRKQWKKQQRSEEALELDEDQLELTLKGTPDSLSLLELHCSYTRNLKPQSLLLNCKWFNKTEFSIDLIPEVQSCFYQCSAEDIGTSIMVQAQPIVQQGSYKGMPLNRTIGPITINQQLATQLEQAYGLKQLKLTVKVQTQGLWKETLLNVTQERLQFQGQFSQSLERKQCRMQILKKTNNQGFLRSQELSLKLKFQSNVKRDLLFLYLKGQQTKQLPLESQPRTVDSNSLNLFLSKQNDSLQTQLNLLRKDLLRSTQRLAVRESYIADLEEQAKVIRRQLGQEHKEELLKRNQKQSQLRDQMVSLEKDLQQSKALNMFYSLQLLKLRQEHEQQGQVRSLKTQVKHLEEEVLRLAQQGLRQEKQLEQARSEASLLSESLKAERVEANRLAERNRALMQQNESLQDELSIQSNNLQLLKNDTFALYTDRINRLQAENSALQSDVLHLRTLLHAERTISKSDEGLANSIREMLLWDDKQVGMHKLANTLAEQLVLKQEELQQQRKVSRQLMKLIRKDD